MRHRHTQAKRDSQSVLCLTVLTAFALLMSSIQAVEAQGTETFRLEGTVRKVTDEPVGGGFTVEAINQRVPTGWLLELLQQTKIVSRLKYKIQDAGYKVQ